MHANPVAGACVLKKVRRGYGPRFSEGTPIVRELHALQDALRVVDGGEDPGKARAAAKRALASRPRHSPPLIDQVIRCSIAKIAGETIPARPLGKPTQSSSENHLVETASLAWTAWLTASEPGRAASESLRIQSESPTWLGQPGALHRTTNTFWLSAIERLEAQDVPEARRLWQRAIEIGASLGIESHPAILWSYAASFFPI